MNIDNAISIGIDFGSDSVRALAVRCADGRELASASAAYRAGPAACTATRRPSATATIRPTTSRR